MRNPRFRASSVARISRNAAAAFLENLLRGGVELIGRMILKFERGATQLGFVDVLTAVILLGILLWVATLQFAVYKAAPAKPASASATASTH
jgi:hypothetical protein